MQTPIPPTILSDSSFSSLKTATNAVLSGQLNPKTCHIFATQEGVFEPLGPASTTFLFTSDVAGKIQFTSVSGTGQQTGYQFSIPYLYNPIVLLTPANENAGKNLGGVYIISSILNPKIKL